LRFLTLVVVAVLHAALIALMLMTGVGHRILHVSSQPIELIYIPTLPPPPVRADSGRPRRLRPEVALSPAAPLIASSAPPAVNSFGPASRGSGVDWLAEAHRAVKAYEIRRDHPSDNAL
jgi:hypothetical protein